MNENDMFLKKNLAYHTHDVQLTLTGVHHIAANQTKSDLKTEHAAMHKKNTLRINGPSYRGSGCV